MEPSPVIQMRGIWKSFGGLVALRGVDFHVNKGETVGVVGDNGAGKSTLMKVLSGAYTPDVGVIKVEGREVRFNSPIDARRHGIAMVYQDMGLIGALDVACNIYLGQEPMITLIPGVLKILDRKQMYKDAALILDSLKINIGSPKKKVRGLSGGQQKAVAIGKVLPQKVQMVIMDEPTAALGVREVNEVLALIDNLRKKGVSVVIISHRMQDVFSTCNRIVILRSGSVVANRNIHDITATEAVEFITGADVLKSLADFRQETESSGRIEG